MSSSKSNLVSKPVVSKPLVSKPLMALNAMLLLAAMVLNTGESRAQVVTGPVALSNVPIYATSPVKPNVMFTLDNSGSMNWEFAPMWVNPGAGADLYAGKYCLTNFQFNNLYYNPWVTYRPPIRADGTRMPDSTYTAAWKDGFHTGDGTLNLSTNYVTLANYRTAPSNGFYQSGNRGAFYAIYSGPATLSPWGTCQENVNYTEVNMNLATAAQQTNFANWYSYYRKRLYAMKASVGEAFRTVDDGFRVGFYTINGAGNMSASGYFMPPDTFTGLHRTNWYNNFYNQDPTGGTPLRDASWKIGEYYRVARHPVSGATLTTATTPKDPILYSCQQNYHILSTDGQWTDGTAPAPSGQSDFDNTLPSNPDVLTVLGTEFGATFLAGQPWPRPYRQNPGAPASGTLADLAAYYWMTDLRPAMPNNVSTSSGNLANWQHMVTYGVVFSEQGNIPYPDGINDILAGSAEWPAPTAGTASTIDDLWHAAVVGHGQYFNVTTPEALTSALGRALNEIRARSGSAAGASFSSQDLTSSGAYAYRPGFTAGDWTGELAAYEVESTTGVVSLHKAWSASTLLNNDVAPAGPGGGWDMTRKIATYRPDTKVGVPFRWTNLSGTQQATITGTTLAAGATGQMVIDYLRGDTTNEDGAGIVRLFRQRTSVLGDIVNSEPKLVAKPSEGYGEAFNPGYEAFVSSKSARRPVLYVGSNDGMLHAFDATVGNSSSGRELWAFVPGLSFQTGADGLASLTWRASDPAPAQFSHRFRVDQTPMVKDVNFGETAGATGGADWRTILVSGMNKGGRGYFALDVTNPEAASEAEVAQKVLWQFTGDTDGDAKMGYTYGEPLIIKTRRWGWVVAVSSGYNNAAGTGHIWILNARTGAVLHRFDSGYGSAAVPSGLARINNFMASSRSQIAEQIYATDLLGNVIRFNVASANAADWTSTGVTIASIGKMITTAPSISANPFNANERWVFVGTGKQLDVADMTGASALSVQNTMFGFKDGSATTPGTFATPLTASDLMPLPLGGSVPSDPSVKGYYATMPVGSSIVTAATIVRGNVVWSATTPTTDPCTPGATSQTYARDMSTGANKIIGATSIATGANVVKTSVLKLANWSQSTSKGKFKLNFSYGDGTGGPGPRDQNLDFTLTGGRTGIRYVWTQ